MIHCLKVLVRSVHQVITFYYMWRVILFFIEEQSQEVCFENQLLDVFF